MTEENKSEPSEKGSQGIGQRLLSPSISSEENPDSDFHIETYAPDKKLISNTQTSIQEPATVSKRIKWLQTITYYCIYIAEGFTWGCIGPTLLLLAEQNGTTQESIGSLFVGT
jgi:hypothetical protein